MRVIAMTGGKGGIGKTTLSVNLAIAMAKAQKKVMLFDADLGLANVDVLLGLNPVRNISDFITGVCSLDEICITGPYGLKIIPASSGMQQLADLNVFESAELIRSFSLLTDQLDYLFIDMASGISAQVIDFTQAAQDILIIVCNDPSSLMDSYAIMKILHQKYARNRFGVVVNKVVDQREGFDVFSKFQAASSKFIHVNMNYLGSVFEDDYVHLAARKCNALVDEFPQSDAAKSILDVAHHITEWPDEKMTPGGIHFFFDRFIQHYASKDKQCTA